MNETTTVVPDTEANASPAPTVNPMLGRPADWLLAKYVALRDRKKELDDAHKKEMEPYNLHMGNIEAALLDILNSNKADNMKLPGGTFYKTTRTSAVVTRWADVLDYIREKEAWELLEARVSTTAAQAILEETQAAIPGVEVKRETRLNVRRS